MTAEFRARAALFRWLWVMVGVCSLQMAVGNSRWFVTTDHYPQPSEESRTGSKLWSHGKPRFKLVLFLLYIMARLLIVICKNASHILASLNAAPLTINFTLLKRNGACAIVPFGKIASRPSQKRLED